MSKETFQAALEEFGIPQYIADRLWNGNIRSTSALASAETSAIRGLVDHPVLNTILPILQQHSDEISTAVDPHKHAVELLRHLAEAEDEGSSSTNSSEGGDEMSLMDETPSTSRSRESSSPEQTDQPLNESQDLSTEDEGEIPEENNSLGQRQQGRDEDYERGDTEQHGNTINANISGSTLNQPNIGGTTYNIERQGRDEDYKLGDTVQHGNTTNANISGGILNQPNIGGTTYHKDSIFIEGQQDRDEDYERGDTVQRGNKVKVEVSGGILNHPNIGGTTYNIEKAQIHVNVYPPSNQGNQPTPRRDEADEVDEPQSSGIQTERTEVHSNKAIAKLRGKMQQLHPSNRDVVFPKSQFPTTSDRIAQVCPQIYLVGFYEGNVVPDDNKYNPKSRTIKLTKSDHKVTFNQFIEEFKTQSFICIAGYPGIGKTTLSKRLTRELLEVKDFVVFRFLFLDMSNTNHQKLTFKDFLLGNINLNLNKNEKASAFQWISNHPDKCYIILDGYDQVSWSIKEDLVVAEYDTPLTHQQLISNLCHGYFLKNCHVIFTSRPHSMLQIPKRCRPQVYFLRDLAPQDMKQLFYSLINNQDQADGLWDALRAKAPQLEAMCHNPLMLQLYVRACLSSSKDSGNITTMTKVFQVVLQNLRSSNHVDPLRLTEPLVLKLSRVAYKATKKGTVLITSKDLKKKSLTSGQVQDLVVTLWGANKECGLLEGHQRLYFSHQTFQEFFAAFYISQSMSVRKFTSFLRKRMLEEHWSVVVNFLSGILLNQDRANDERSEKRVGRFTSLKFWKKDKKDKEDKKDLFLAALERETKQVAKNGGHRRTLSICKICRESDNVEVIDKVASWFDGGEMRLWNISLTKSDAHPVACVIKASSGRIRELHLDGCKMNSDTFAIVSDAIQQMNGKICALYIWNNNLTSVDEVIRLLSKVEDEVWMRNCFDDGRGGRRDANDEEKTKLQQALDGLENMKLEIVLDFHGRIRLKHKNRVD